MMKQTLLAAGAVAMVGLFSATPANAQERPDYRLDFGVNGGYAWYTDALDVDAAQTNNNNVKFESGWLVGSQLTWWATDRVGIRANGTYTERPLVKGSWDELDPTTDSNDLIEDVNLWTGSGDLLFRLTSGNSAIGRPYLALGAGAMWYNPAGDKVVNPTSTDAKTGELVDVPGTGGTRTVALLEKPKFMGLAALGTDLRLADHFGVRLELGDRVSRPPIVAGPSFEDNVAKIQHMIYGQIGAQFLMGLEAPEVVAVAPAPPAPAPAPAPAPQPAPKPAEENVSVCVVDPGAPSGIRTVNAIYLPESRDTVVDVTGQRQPLASTLPTVTMASDADWFVQGQPLTINVARNVDMEYTTWQSARIIDQNDLTYLGNVRGVPVYASSGDVSAVSGQLEGLRGQQMDNDLSAMIKQSPELRDALEDAQYLYVPLRPTGCVFQTVRQVEQVRKKDR